MSKIRKVFDNKIFMLAVMIAMIELVTCFPFLKAGIGGYEPDLLFHLLRIEGVKDNLSMAYYPNQIYYNFFHSFGYGSPLFYPDVWLVIPAIFRLAGMNIELTWKVFVAFIVLLVTLSTFISLNGIVKNWKCGMLGTYLLVLSQFFLADLQVRVGLSEYIAYIFLPILVWGIYDLFHNGGEKVYLLGIGLTGMLLTHTIMTFLGGLFLVSFFIGALCFPNGRKVVFSKEIWKKLIKTAILSFMVSSFYLLPMLEQMMNCQYRYTIAFQKVGNFMQPFLAFFRLSGYFNYIAYVGIGYPIILFLLFRFSRKKFKNPWVDIGCFGGIVLLLIMTPVFPWKLFNDTILNSIQFTYRIYPYALILLVMGILFTLLEKFGNNVSNKIIVVGMVLSICFGAYQNYTVYTGELHTVLTEEYLESRCNEVGSGEWLPVPINQEVENLTRSFEVLSSQGEPIQVEENADKTLNFHVKEDALLYIAPRIYYKGYSANLTAEDGTVYQLSVEKSEDGLVEISNKTGEAGTISIKYTGTFLQKLSMGISLLGIIMCLYLGLKSYGKKA